MASTVFTSPLVDNPVVRLDGRSDITPQPRFWHSCSPFERTLRVAPQDFGLNTQSLFVPYFFFVSHACPTTDLVSHGKVLQRGSVSLRWSPAVTTPLTLTLVLLRVSFPPLLLLPRLPLSFS